MPRIRFLHSKDIDLERWDNCVNNSGHTAVYALSGWLNIMARQWSGLVQDDYRAVLPIPWNRKYFIPYIYTPRFTSPLPLCGDPENTLALNDFLAEIPSSFALWDLDLRSPQAPASIDQKFLLRSNYLLNLSPTYETLFSGFRNGYRNLIHRAKKNGFNVRATNDFETIIQLAEQKKQIRGLKPDDYSRFEKLCTWLQKRGMIDGLETIGPDNTRCAAAITVHHQQKIYYLLAWSNDIGRENAASHLLMDHLIATNAAQPMVLDFEGSDIPEIAFFFTGFGATKETYPAIRKRPFQ